jgi:hypothetical protein
MSATRDLPVRLLEKHFRTSRNSCVIGGVKRGGASRSLRFRLRVLQCAFFHDHWVQLAALAQLGAGYQSSDGRRFDELGMADEYQEEVTILDPIANRLLDNGTTNSESFPQDRCRRRRGCPVRN